MKNKLLAGMLFGVCAIGLAAKDEVIMTVNGVDVPRSEFEYLFNKNLQQQLTPQPLEEYVEMFKLYKLKVADAKAAGLDTLASFRKEMAQYREELAAPYMTDSVYLNSLIQETADRARQEAEAYHIMMMKTRDAQENARLFDRLDSIAGVLKSGGDFEELARKYSQDPSARTNGGYLGYITVNHFPYIFEKNVFTLKEGELSDIVESPVGYHLIKGGKKRDSRGTVLVSHIMRMAPRGKEGPEADRAKALIDSLWQVAKTSPERFEDLAREYSEDRGTAGQGGRLPWFGAGEMVVEFDSVSFALGQGELSTPFQTAYGWHIVKKLDSKPHPTAADIKGILMARMASPQDERYRIIMKHQNDHLLKKHKAHVDAKVLGEMQAYVAQNGLDSVFSSTFSLGTKGHAALIAGAVNKPVMDFLDYVGSNIQTEPRAASRLLDELVDGYVNSVMTEVERDWLGDNVADYRNLLNEYNDGSLLYEISVREVWDKAAKDNEGLEKYFAAHRDDYRWQEPHAKGFLVQTVNDSVAALIKSRLSELGGDTITRTLRKEFPKQVQIDKVLVSKGKNQMVDNLMFGGPEVTPQNANFTTYFMYEPRLIEVPEDVNDVRGLVTSDYQNELQQKWEDKLRSKYPVTVNEKVLKKIKKNMR